MNFLIHPIAVHFPIAFYFLELILLVFWLRKKEPFYFSFALFAFKIAYVFMILAVLAGLTDIGGFDGIQGKVIPHFIAAASVFTLYTTKAFFWRFADQNGAFYRQSHLLLSISGNILIAIAGYFGGLMVYGT